jgi:hypothetical protein
MFFGHCFELIFKLLFLSTHNIIRRRYEWTDMYARFAVMFMIRRWVIPTAA